MHAHSTARCLCDKNDSHLLQSSEEISTLCSALPPLCDATTRRAAGNLKMLCAKTLLWTEHSLTERYHMQNRHTCNIEDYSTSETKNAKASHSLLH